MVNIIGIGGVARCGKDTMANHIVSELISLGKTAKRYSFAKALRDECDRFLIETVGISAYTEDPEHKKIIRPFLVFWGTDFRRKLNEKVWIEKIRDQIEEDGVDYAVISDVRFENETEFVHSKNGFMLHLSRKDNGNLVPPANETEAENDPKVHANSNYLITWETTDDEDLLKQVCSLVLGEALTYFDLPNNSGICQ